MTVTSQSDSDRDSGWPDSGSESLGRLPPPGPGPWPSRPRRCCRDGIQKVRSHKVTKKKATGAHEIFASQCQHAFFSQHACSEKNACVNMHVDMRFFHDRTPAEETMDWSSTLTSGSILKNPSWRLCGVFALSFRAPLHAFLRCRIESGT